MCNRGEHVWDFRIFCMWNVLCNKKVTCILNYLQPIISTNLSPVCNNNISTSTAIDNFTSSIGHLNLPYIPPSSQSQCQAPMMSSPPLLHYHLLSICYSSLSPQWMPWSELCWVGSPKSVEFLARGMNREQHDFTLTLLHLTSKQNSQQSTSI